MQKSNWSISWLRSSVEVAHVNGACGDHYSKLWDLPENKNWRIIDTLKVHIFSKFFKSRLNILKIPIVH